MAYVVMLLMCVLATACGGSAEELPMHGSLVLGTPVGVTTAAATSISIKCAGFDECAVATSPVSFDAIPSTWLESTSWTAATPVILAMSLGIDVHAGHGETICGTGPGQPPGCNDTLDGSSLAEPMDVMLSDPRGGWIVLEFTVDGTFLREGHELAGDVASAQLMSELDGTVFGFTVTGSEAEPLPGELMATRARRPCELGLESSDHIDGLNMHMALYGTDMAGPGSSVFQGALPPQPTIYFTLHPDFVSLADEDLALRAMVTEWCGGFPPNSAAIIQSTWNGQGWTGPSLFEYPEDAFDPMNPSGTPRLVDGMPITVDALAINHEPGKKEASILYSTRNALEDEQVMWVGFDASGNRTEPLRVVVADPPGTRNFRSGGRALGGRRGIGDFCIQDPRLQIPGGFNGLYALRDSFFIARRWPPVPPLAPPPGSLTWGLELAVSGFRQRVGGVPIMRTCMAWRRGLRPPGEAFVQWGLAIEYTEGVPVDPSRISWFAQTNLHFDGGPLVADTAIPLGFHGFVGNTALVAQWSLVSRNSVYLAPLCVLKL